MQNQITVERTDYISSIDGKTYYGSEITFPIEIREGSAFIRFKNELSPLSLRCYHIGSEDYGYKCATFDYDFGMTHTVPLEQEHNCILTDSDGRTDEEKIAFDVIFDLFHAFFHPKMDTNYTDCHWALYGNLKDRVEIGRYDETEETDETEKNNELHPE